MKQITQKDVKKALRDRWWVGLVVLNILVTAVAVIVIGVSIEPKETQVITHFSSFGITGFYRSYWYSLWGYAALALVILGVHGALSLKLHQLDRRDLSLALLWSTVGITVVVLIFALSIIKIAALG